MFSIFVYCFRPYQWFRNDVDKTLIGQNYFAGTLAWLRRVRVLATRTVSVLRLTRSQVLRFSGSSSQVDKISRDEKRDKLASPDLIPGEKERRWIFLPRENFDSSKIIERLPVFKIFEQLTNGWPCSRYSCHAGVDSDYQTLQHIHSNITTINRFLVLRIVRL